MKQLLSERVQSLKPSATIAINSKASALKASGVDVVNLSAGEPDFDTPNHIKNAGIDAIRQGFTRYTPSEGTRELLMAVCRKFESDNDLCYQPENVMINSGGKFSTYLAMQALINPGDKVIIPAPYWVSFPPMVELAGGIPVIVKAKATNGFKLTPEDMKDVDLTRVKAIIINSPSNPTGALYSKEELDALLTPLAEKGVIIISDEMYEDLVYEGEFCSVASISELLFKQTLTLNGVSKAYAMTGWRIGYAAGNADLIKAMRNIQSQSTSNPCSISQKAATEALSSGHVVKGELLERFKERRDFICNALWELKEFTLLKPSGAFYVFPEISERLQKACCTAMPNVHPDLAFSAYLLEKQHTAVVPGEGFGLSSCFRISYAVETSEVEVGMKRISRGVKELLG